VTHTFELDDIQEAYDLFSRQRDGVLKVALHPTRSVASEGRGMAAVAALDEQC